MATTIYKITNLVNSKSYIGKTRSRLSDRWRGHLYDMQRLNSPNIPLYNAIKKYGEDKFTIEPVVICMNEEANCCEREAIIAYGTKRPHGYNATDGGDGSSGFRPDEITRAKLSAVHKGKRLTEEHKEKIRRGMTGIVNSVGYTHSQEIRAKISANYRRREYTPAQRKRLSELRAGTKLTQEHKNKISASLKIFYAKRKPDTPDSLFS